MYVFEKYGVQLTYKEIFSRGKDTKITDENYQLLKDSENFLDILDERIIFHDGTLNSEKYKNHVIRTLPKTIICHFSNGNFSRFPFKFFFL